MGEIGIGERMKNRVWKITVDYPVDYYISSDRMEKAMKELRKTLHIPGHFISKGIEVKE